MYAKKLKSFSAPNANSGEATQKIDDNAFFSCGLESFTTPGCIQKIGKDAFSCCSSLKSVIIPSSVTTIGKDAFSLCNSSLVIKTEAGSAAEKYCGSAWGVKCEYLTTSEISEIYGEEHAEKVAQARETAAQEAAANARPANNVKSSLTYTKYSFMADKWNVYYATFLSNSTLKIERWNRWQAGANGDPFQFSYDVCTINIIDGSTDFFWLDDDQTAFSISLTDENDSDFDGTRRVGFAIATEDIEGISEYSYYNDKWDWYRAYALSDTVVKIEKWSRFNAGADGDPFAHDSDICIIQIGNPSTDFAWTDDNHVAFTITMQDEENSYWDDVRVTPFGMDVVLETTPYYVYQNDKWDLYKAYLLSQNTIKIEKWTRFNAGEDGDPFQRTQDICIIRIDEGSFGFSWTDQTQSAFTVTLMDDDNSYWEEEALVPFAIENNGETYKTLTYLNDRWDLYVAVVLSDETVVIENWSRFNAGEGGDPFKREYGVLAVNTSDGSYDFAWTDESHVAFTLTMEDAKNSYWDGEQQVSFAIDESFVRQVQPVVISAPTPSPEQDDSDESSMVEPTIEPTIALTAAPTVEPTKTPEATIAPTPTPYIPPVELDIDLSTYTDDEIVALLYLVNQEVTDRKIEKSAKLPEGEYLIGRDIPAGNYYYSHTRTDGWSAYIKVWRSTKAEDPMLSTSVRKDGEYFITLEDGNIFSSDEEFILKIAAGPLFQ